MHRDSMIYCIVVVEEKKKKKLWDCMSGEQRISFHCKVHMSLVDFNICVFVTLKKKQKKFGIEE